MLQFKEYLERAEYIKRCMDGKQEVSHTAGNGEGPTQKSRPNGGGGGGGGGGKDDVSTHNSEPIWSVSYSNDSCPKARFACPIASSLYNLEC